MMKQVFLRVRVTAARVAAAMATSVLAAMMTASAPARAETPADYAGAITLKPAAGEAIQRVEVPVTVYAGIQHADLRDVRVFNAAQEPVPFAFAGTGESAAPLPPPATHELPLFAIREDPSRKPEDRLSVKVEQRADGSVVSIVSRDALAPASAPPRRILAWLADAARLESNVVRLRPQWKEAPSNYIGAARVESSDDLKSWRTVTGNAPIVFLAQGASTLVQDLIELPSTRARYYRLSFTPAVPELSGLVVEAPSQRPEAPRLTLQVSGKPGEKPGEILYDTGVRAPVDRVRLIVAQQNALAPVRLETRADEKAEWRAVASTVAYKMVRDGAEQSSPSVRIPTNTHAWWRAVVEQSGGGLGTPLPELELSWPARHIVFLARGEGPFTLAFGKRDAAPAALPLATVMPGYKDGSEAVLPMAVVSEVKLRPAAPPPVMTRIVGDTEPRKLWLWGALLVGVLVLGLMVWRLARQMRQGPPPG